jgi:hypothetical protein
LCVRRGRGSGAECQISFAIFDEKRTLLTMLETQMPERGDAIKPAALRFVRYTFAAAIRRSRFL